MDNLYFNASWSPPGEEKLLAEQYYSVLCYMLLVGLVGMVDRVGLA